MAVTLWSNRRKLWCRFPGHRVGASWMWTFAFGHHEDRTPTHSYETTLRGRSESLRKELAAGMTDASRG
jgi:hypothetical protein